MNRGDNFLINVYIMLIFVSFLFTFSKSFFLSMACFSTLLNKLLIGFRNCGTAIF